MSCPRLRTAALVTVALVAVAASALAPAGPASAEDGVSGEAFGHYTKVGLFGGPPSANGPAPMVTLPASGSATPVTGSEPMASAVYGPAHIFGGRWPIDAAVAPPSGPISVSTKGTPGPNGSVTSTADIVLFPTPLAVQCDGQPPGTANCKAPGGFGPTVPNEGDELHATCTASAGGPPTGSARIVNGILATSTDSSGEPLDTEPIPENPPPNYTRTGTISNVGDNWRLVYNEQFIDADGSITVNAIHMYLLGAIAVGEQILGHVRCSMHPAPPSELAAPPSTRARTNDVALAAKETSSTSAAVPLALGGAVVVAGIGVAAVRSRRRRAIE